MQKLLPCGFDYFLEKSGASSNGVSRMFDNSSILITGGTGSFGQKCVARLIGNYKVKRLIVYSRDELKQFEMSQRLASTALRFSLVMYATYPTDDGHARSGLRYPCCCSQADSRGRVQSNGMREGERVRGRQCDRRGLCERREKGVLSPRTRRPRPSTCMVRPSWSPTSFSCRRITWREIASRGSA